MQKGKVKEQSQDKQQLPKGDKEGVTVHSQNNTHSFWLEQPAFVTGVGAGERVLAPSSLSRAEGHQPDPEGSHPRKTKEMALQHSLLIGRMRGDRGI